MKSLIGVQWKMFWKSKKAIIALSIIFALLFLVNVLIVFGVQQKWIIYSAISSTSFVLMTVSAGVVSTSIFYNYNEEGMEYLLYSKPLSRKQIYWSNFIATWLVFLLWISIYTVAYALLFALADIILHLQKIKGYPFCARNNLVLLTTFFFGSVIYGFLVISLVAISSSKISAKAAQGIIYGALIGGSYLFHAVCEVSKAFDSIVIYPKDEDKLKYLKINDNGKNDLGSKGYEIDFFIEVDNNEEAKAAYKNYSKVKASTVLSYFDIQNWLSWFIVGPIDGIENTVAYQLALDDFYKKASISEYTKTFDDYHTFLSWNKDEKLYIADHNIADHRILDQEDLASYFAYQKEVSIDQYGGVYWLGWNSDDKFNRSLYDKYNKYFISAMNNDNDFKALNPTEAAALIQEIEKLNADLANNKNMTSQDYINKNDALRKQAKNIIWEFIWKNRQELFNNLFAGGFDKSVDQAKKDELKNLIDSNDLDAFRNADSMEQIVRAIGLRIDYMTKMFFHNQIFNKKLSNIVSYCNANKDLDSNLNFAGYKYGLVFNPKDYEAKDATYYKHTSVAIIPWYISVIILLSLGALVTGLGYRNYLRYNFKA